MSELKKDSVERTLCIPLWSRAIAVKKLPQILPDHDAVRILKEMGETIINYGDLPYTDFIRTKTLWQGGDVCNFRVVRHKTDAGDGWERSKSI